MITPKDILKHALIQCAKHGAPRDMVERIKAQYRVAVMRERVATTTNGGSNEQTIHPPQ